jgi:predicted nuclease with RNAse H fold
VVALDGERRIVASAGTLSAIGASALIFELDPTMVCIDSPSGWAATGKRRQSEIQLAAAGIRCFPTGADPGDHPFYRWVRVGFALFGLLEDAFPLYRGGDPAGSAAEVFPHATALRLGGPRRPGETKARHRRRVLAEQWVDEDRLRNADRVDAALASLTGLLALEGRCESLGTAEEGMVLLPLPTAGAGQARS